MPDLVEELLELEGAKHRALLACNSEAYEKQVKLQLQLLAENPDLQQAAQRTPERVHVLSRLTRLNTLLLHNHFAASPVFAANGAFGKGEYTSGGSLATRPPSNFSVEA